MKKLSVVIMAHPKRAHLIPYLKEKLGDVPVVFDRKNNVWDTCRRAWLAHDFDAEYGVVIQDDALITSDFYAKAEKILTGDFIYSFYAGNMLQNRIRMAEERGKDHVISGMIFNEIALCMKMSRVRNMVKFCDAKKTDTDHEIVKWARAKNLNIFYTIPSLVDHRDEESIYRDNYGKVFASKEPRKAVRYVS